MGRLAYRFSDVIRKLQAAGYVVASQKGSHVKLVKVSSEGTRVTIVPHHRDIATGTMRGILRQTGISVEEFEAL
jgi:predicted RNA binding protein YcfA (HicA-like mRNA interferase family)